MSRLIARSFPQVEVVGVDVREQYLDFARARAREEGIHNLTFERGDVFALPFPGCKLRSGVEQISSAMAEGAENRPGRVQAGRQARRMCRFVRLCRLRGSSISRSTPELERKIREIMALLVDVNIGRKVPAYMIALGFRDVQVDIETDTLFTVIGRIDAEQAAEFGDPISGDAAASVQILGSEAKVDSAGRSFPRPLRRSGDLQLHRPCISPAALCEGAQCDALVLMADRVSPS